MDNVGAEVDADSNAEKFLQFEGYMLIKTKEKGWYVGAKVNVDSNAEKILLRQSPFLKGCIQDQGKRMVCGRKSFYFHFKVVC